VPQEQLPQKNSNEAPEELAALIALTHRVTHGMPAGCLGGVLLFNSVSGCLVFHKVIERALILEVVSTRSMFV
jgi:hypothetical protein